MSNRIKAMDSPRNRSLALWLAALAILWGRLVPSLSAAMETGTGKHWIEACMTAGNKLVAVADDDGADQATSGPGMHCPARSPHPSRAPPIPA